MDKKAIKIAICKDVLERLDQRNIVHGIYCSSDGFTCEGFNENVEDIDAQDYIEDMEQKCSVCALGSCFLSYIRLVNQVKLGEVVSKSWFLQGELIYHPGFTTIYKKLENIFSNYELSIIENLFEVGWGVFISNNKEKLKIIMEKIIECDGDIDKAGQELHKGV